MSALFVTKPNIGSASSKWFIPPTRATLSWRQTATQEPSTVVIMTCGSVTTRYSPWTMGMRFIGSGQLAEDALDLFLQRRRGERLHDINVDAHRRRLLHELAIRGAGQHDDDGLADDRILAHRLEELEAVHLRHVVI